MTVVVSPIAPHLPFGDSRLPGRFWSKAEESGDGCWLWTASLSHEYGQIYWQGGPQRAHRVAWVHLVAELAAGEELDHRCRNKACVNPAHLNPVTRKQNLENHSGPNRTNRTSGVRNVHWDGSRNCWRVRVQHNGRHYSAGRYADLDQAAAAARRLRCQLFTNNLVDYEDEAVA